MTARNLHSAAFAAILLGMVSACATAEPDPCTAEWIEWKKDDLLAEFAQAYRSDIRALRNLGDDLREPSMLAAIRLANRAQTIGEMAETFVDETVPDIQASLSPCLTDPLSASTLMGDFLDQQGVDPEVVSWVQALGAFVETRQQTGT